MSNRSTHWKGEKLRLVREAESSEAAAASAAAVPAAAGCQSSRNVLQARQRC